MKKKNKKNLYKKTLYKPGQFNLNTFLGSKNKSDYLLSFGNYWMKFFREYPQFLSDDILIKILKREPRHLTYLFFQEVSSTYQINEKMMYEFKEMLNWSIYSRIWKYEEMVKYLDKYQEYIYWGAIIAYRGDLTLDFLIKYKDKVNFYIKFLKLNKVLDENIKRKFINYSDLIS